MVNTKSFCVAEVPKHFLQFVFHITYALLKQFFLFCFLQSECFPVFSPVIAQYLPFFKLPFLMHFIKLREHMWKLMCIISAPLAAPNWTATTMLFPNIQPIFYIGRTTGNSTTKSSHTDVSHCLNKQSNVLKVPQCFYPSGNLPMTVFLVISVHWNWERKKYFSKEKHSSS